MGTGIKPINNQMHTTDTREEIEKSLENYPLIPMDEIEAEARLIAVRWVENYEPCGFDLPNKHKLASDIMNYAKKQQADIDKPASELNLQEENKRNAIEYGHWLFRRLFPLQTSKEIPEEAEALYQTYLTEKASIQ